MITLFLSALLASVPSTGNISAQADTVNRYVIDGEPVSNFNGTQLAGKSIASYDIVTSKEKDKVVINHIIYLDTSAKPVNDVSGFSGDGTEDHYVDMTKTTSMSDSVITITIDERILGGLPAKRIKRKGMEIVIHHPLYPCIPAKRLKIKGMEIYNPSPIGLPTELSELMLVIDGEKVTKEEFQKLKPSDIKSMTILRGEPAVKLWGPEAANGGVEVNTNKK